MCEGNSLPYGLISLVECMSRAALLAHPDDIPGVLGFLSTHAQKLLHSNDGGSNDTVDVAFLYQEQWENNFLREQLKKTEVPKPSTEDLSLPAPSVSAGSSHSQDKRMSPTAEGKQFSSNEPTQLPPQLHGQRGSSVRVAKPSLACPMQAPPVRQRAHLKKARGQMSTKMGDRVYMCPLADCPYHNKKEDRSPADGVGSIGTSTGCETKLQKANAEPKPVKMPIPYRPKGGYIVDPELQPRRGRAAVCGRQASNLPPEISVDARLRMNHCAHIIRYKRMYAQCSKLQPHSRGWNSITSQADQEVQEEDNTPRNSSAVSQSSSLAP